MGGTICERCEEAYQLLQESIAGVSDDEAAAFRSSNWPAHDGALGEDGSIASLVWHCAGWKELWAIYFQTGENADRAGLGPAVDSWSGRRQWLADSHERLMEHLRRYGRSDVVDVHGKTLNLNDYDITNGEHDTYHAAQIWYLRQRWQSQQPGR